MDVDWKMMLKLLCNVRYPLEVESEEDVDEDDHDMTE